MVKAAGTYEKSLAGGYISGNNYRTVIDFCVTTVSFAHGDRGGVGWLTNSPRDDFIRYARYFQFNLD